MHILITDSGVGGLSVVAYAERFVREHGSREPVRLTFANAAPANDYGYNSMPTREEKLATFDLFLRNVAQRFAPDSIYVACNTLSVLLPDTPFFANARLPIDGIVSTGVKVLRDELEADPRSVAIIFATQTTIDAGTYPRLLTNGSGGGAPLPASEGSGGGAPLPAGEGSGVRVSRRIDPARIITQPCPGLADVISEDREGTKTKHEIKRWVDTAIAKMPDRTSPVIASLNCTHYGYRKDLFGEALTEAGIKAKVVNPNERAVDDLFPSLTGGPHRDVDVRFVTRYALPDSTVETLTCFLAQIAPTTIAAMQHFEHVPDLF